MSNTVASSDASELKVNQLDDELLASLFESYRDSFIHHIRSRMDVRLVSQMDPIDVLQEAFIVAKAKLPQRRTGAIMNALVWVRLELDQAIAQIHRSMLRLKRNPLARVVSLHGYSNGKSDPQCESMDIPGAGTSPSKVAMRKESKAIVDSLMKDLSENDRAILALRHFECLSNQDCAHALRISPKAASERYRRALVALERSLRNRNG